jgi:hypothetical protein
MVLTPIEREVLINVTEDLCTLAELKDRLEPLGFARSHTRMATLWLEHRGLIEGWGRTSLLYRPTAAGVTTLAALRRREPVARFLLRPARAA